VANVYRLPASDATIFGSFAKDIELIQLKREKSVILIVGDFNCHHSDWLGSKDCNGDSKTNESGNECFDLCQTLGLVNMVKGNTFLRNVEAAISVLDLAITDSPKLFSDVQLSKPIGVSPHACVKLQMNQACKSHQCYSKTSWKYHLAKWDCMKLELTNCDWNIDQDDVDAIWKNLKATS